MKQKTIRDLGEALLWVQTNDHHICGLEGTDPWASTHWVLQNHHEKIRLWRSDEWHTEFLRLIVANPRPHDNRMYALTPEGKRRLGKLGLKYDRKLHP